MVPEVSVSKYWRLTELSFSRFFLLSGTRSSDSLALPLEPSVPHSLSLQSDCLQSTAVSHPISFYSILCFCCLFVCFFCLKTYPPLFLSHSVSAVMGDTLVACNHGDTAACLRRIGNVSHASFFSLSAIALCTRHQLSAFLYFLTRPSDPF